MKSNIFKRLAGAMVLMASFIFSASAVFGAANYQIPITVSGYDGTEELENFPILVRLSEKNAQTGEGIAGFSYDKCASDGRDVAFTIEDGIVLPREIDTWNPAGESLIWVRVPKLVNNLEIVCTYGDASIAAQPASQTDGSVWKESGYIGVWHMNNASPADSCGNYNGTGTSVSEADGALGTALDFSGNRGQAVTLPLIDRAILLSGCTIESWLKIRSGGGSYGRSVFNIKDFLSVRQNGSNTEITTPGVKDYTAAAIGAPLNDWYHLTVSFVQKTVNNGVVIYSNGESKVAMETTNVKQESGTAEAWIGDNQWGGQVMDGLIDEIRLSSVIRSADWVNAGYDTSAAGTDFLSYGDAIFAADNTAVRVIGSPAKYGTSSPDYGVTTGYRQGEEVKFEVSPSRVRDGEREVVLVGWEHYSVDIESGKSTLQKSYNAAEDSLDSYTCTFNGLAEFRWLWSLRYPVSVENPIISDVSDDSVKFTIYVGGIGFNSESAVLDVLYGASPDALTGKREVEITGTAPGTYEVSLPRSAQGAALYVKAVLKPESDTAAESSVVSFKLRSDALCLKPLAEGENRTAVNGLSWATAFVDPVEAMRSAEAVGKPLYVAQGIHMVTNHLYAASKELKIYGGFPGVSDDETLDDRDAVRYESVFSGDEGQDDKWSHFVPGDFTATETKADVNIIQNGRLVSPSAYTEDYDVYVNNIGSGNSSYAVKSNKSIVIDGITIFGFKATGQVGGSYVGAVTLFGSKAVITNCTFIGNYYNYGVVYGSASDMHIVDCKFINLMSGSRAAGLTPHGGTMRVDNCYFESLYRGTGGGAGLVFNAWSGCIQYIRNAMITRSLLAQGGSYNTAYGGDGNFFGAEGGYLGEVSDCVISNCFTASSTAECLNFVSPGRAGELPFTRCYFVNNRSHVKPVDGKNYSMFGHQSGDATSRYFSFIDCTFSGNVIEAIDVAATKGSYVLSITGNYGERQDMSFINCVFDDNKAIAKEVVGVTPILCRGIATAAYVPDAKNQVGIANTIFRSTVDDGAYDFVQYGSAHLQPINIVNTIFVGLNDVIHKAIYTDKPELVKLYSCQVQNNLMPPGGVVATNYEYDRVPVVKEILDAKTGRYTYLRDAKTPGYSTGCDIATNSYSRTLPAGNVSWAFRTREENAAWQALTPSVASLNTGMKHNESPALDALGTVQTFGSVSRGPTKTLTEKAANGASVVLRREPFAAGSFNYDSVQSAAKNTPIVSVTASAVSSQTAEFEKWENADGTTYSTEATLTGSFEDEITILTAKYAAPKVMITFDLEGCGIFNENGQDTIQKEYTAYEPFDNLPSYTMSDEYHLVKWDIPDTVPLSGATYKAYIIPSYRIICVVPANEAPSGVQDGTSWATAYTDIQTAVTNAGLYKGEVWLKKGIYTISQSVAVKQNVILRGGFAGTETLSRDNASLAEPARNETVLTGDVNGDSYWKGCTPSSLAESPIWLDGVYQAPNPDGLLERWGPEGNKNDNTYTGFILYSADEAEGIGFSGLTFTLFRQSAISFSPTMLSPLVIENCKFTASSMENNERAALYLKNVELRMKDTTFDGNTRGVYLESTTDSLSYITNCLFSNTSSREWSKPGAIFVNGGTSSLEVSGCRFFRNSSHSNDANGGSAVSANGSKSVLLTDCAFEDNRQYGNCLGAVTVNAGNNKILRCRFINNKSISTAEDNGNVSAAIYSSGNLLTEKSYFAGNMLNIDNAKAKNSAKAMASVWSINGGDSAMVNCTLEDNIVSNRSPLIDVGATIARVGDNKRFVVVGTMINGSRHGAESGCAQPKEFTDWSNRPFALVNSVLNNQDAAYVPIKLVNSGAKAYLFGSIVSKLESAVIPPAEQGSTITNVVSVTVNLKNLDEGPDGTLARRPLGAAEYAKLTFPVYRKNDTTTELYLRNDETPDTPWFRLGEYTMKSDKDSGLNADAEPIEDAFDNPRKERLAIPGPLHAANPATIMIVK